ncbi:Glutaminase kidney isoform_ mitochondriallike, partial [Caligus rogercresseyi]
TDPRLSSMMSCLNMLKATKSPGLDSLKLDTSTFKNMVSETGVLFNKVFQDELIIPDFGFFKEKIASIFHEVSTSKWS